MSYGSSAVTDQNTDNENLISFPVSPKIDENIINEIGAFECEVLGPGVVVFRNAFKIDQELILSYIDGKAEEAHKERWKYIEVNGEKFGINEDGFRYRLVDVPTTPVRLLDPVTSNVPTKVSFPPI